MVVVGVIVILSVWLNFNTSIEVSGIKSVWPSTLIVLKIFWTFEPDEEENLIELVVLSVSIVIFVPGIKVNVSVKLSAIILSWFATLIVLNTFSAFGSYFKVLSDCLTNTFVSLVGGTS